MKRYFCGDDNVYDLLRSIVASAINNVTSEHITENDETGYVDATHEYGERCYAGGVSLMTLADLAAALPKALECDFARFTHITEHGRLCVYREETIEEQRTREQYFQDAQQRTEDYERNLYETLKAKFEGQK